MDQELWHVVVGRGGYILGVYGSAVLSMAQDCARRVEESTGFAAYVRQVRGSRPAIGAAAPPSGSLHAARITENADRRHYALIVRLDSDGVEHVLRGFARHYASRAAAERGVAKYATKHGLRLAPIEEG